MRRGEWKSFSEDFGAIEFWIFMWRLNVMENSPHNFPLVIRMKSLSGHWIHFLQKLVKRTRLHSVHFHLSLQKDFRLLFQRTQRLLLEAIALALHQNVPQDALNIVIRAANYDRHFRALQQILDLNKAESLRRIRLKSIWLSGTQHFGLYLGNFWIIINNSE